MVDVGVRNEGRVRERKARWGGGRKVLQQIRNHCAVQRAYARVTVDVVKESWYCSPIQETQALARNRWSLGPSRRQAWGHLGAPIIRPSPNASANGHWLCYRSHMEQLLGSAQAHECCIQCCYLFCSRRAPAPTRPEAQTVAVLRHRWDVLAALEAEAKDNTGGR